MTTEQKPAFDGKALLARLPTRPGVYLMRDVEGTALYVGKARNLRKRVASYFDAVRSDLIAWGFVVNSIIMLGLFYHILKSKKKAERLLKPLNNNDK